MDKRLIALIATLLSLLLAGCGAPDGPPEADQASAASGPAPTPQPTPNFCGAIGRSYPAWDLAQLAWTSSQIITGRVVEERPAKVAPGFKGPRAGQPQPDQIYREYVVQVEQVLRGRPADTILVRRSGGRVGNCEQVDPSEAPLAIGDHVLLFLRGHNVNTGRQGTWGVKDDGTVVTTYRQHEPYNGQSVGRIGQQIRAALSGGPPATVPPDFLVPLDEAPLPALPTPGRP